MSIVRRIYARILRSLTYISEREYLHKHGLVSIYILIAPDHGYRVASNVDTDTLVDALNAVITEELQKKAKSKEQK